MFIGWGTVDRDGVPPWERTWLQRERQPGTLGVWLRSLSEAPALDWETVPTSPLTASAAAQLAKLLRRRGGPWLSGRDYLGSGPWRPCLGFPSVRAAAAAMGVSRRRIYQMAGLGDYDGGRNGRSP